ncbi:hypothetical protein B5C34_06090 [Pacificimonas flava]|uniref:Superoxide dismutase copper/zinc binding domain-containing protein n=2 Tax=Pacificimonas TaxID=1960290 RepID=A0A219B4J9_9SPHN|nr:MULTISPECIES: superoxide dismutase family protein [Pacificimonas]MBZ6377205.1 superoxide dismutase family protein [Pacificimonas aurantium]OWV33073.1 hypothetical protein B5C34_06090 [Pacificimonas flava]
MKSAGILLAAGTMLALGASVTSCASTGSMDEAAASDEESLGTVTDRAYATAETPEGEAVARAVLAWDGDMIEVTAQLQDMTPGTYAVHLHETGDCSASDFTSAGGHWNPTNEGHGFSDAEDGFHKGDLKNVTVGADGTGYSVTLVSGVSWDGMANSLFDEDGAALIVHAHADDYMTDPAGDAGPRRACGVLQRG